MRESALCRAEGNGAVKPVVIVTAMRREARLLEEALVNPVGERRPGFDALTGLVGGQEVVLCAAGVGKINAAAATAILIERYRPRLVINTGCAGAYQGSGLAIGDLALATSEILGDEGAITSAGWLGLEEMGLPSLVREGRRYYHEIPLSPSAGERALLLAGRRGIPLARGRFVTLSACSGSLSRGEELAGRYGALAENMEGGAVALVCLRYGVECLEIRGISNRVEERNLESWDLPRAVAAAQGFVLDYLEGMRSESITPV